MILFAKGVRPIFEDSHSGVDDSGPGTAWLLGPRSRYAAAMQGLRQAFEQPRTAAAELALAARTRAVDQLAGEVWTHIQQVLPLPARGIALVALGGYGRQELFPCSDVDLLILLDVKVQEDAVKEPISTLNQALWDCGLRVSPLTRSLPECETFTQENVEFTLALLDARYVAGDRRLAGRLTGQSMTRLVRSQAHAISARVLEVTRARHARYGGTAFHLEPNVKECPGGLRDVHVVGWLGRLQTSHVAANRDFVEAREFLLLVRIFLHLRTGRDDNTLDWLAQDAAAAAGLGIGAAYPAVDAAYWMQLYFRNARAVERALAGAEDAAEAMPAETAKVRPPNLRLHAGFEMRQRRLGFTAAGSPDPETVLSLFAAQAATGARLTPEAAARLEQALPIVARDLEDGPNLWRRLQAILLGGFAGAALRSMHSLGLLELVLPEFHGIDALVIRDAYHRYTVDEHTFVLIDTLHRVASAGGSANGPRGVTLAAWTARFGQLFRDLPHPELLLLGSLLHDVGKGHSSPEHAAESARMAANVLLRLELDSYETDLVLELIRNHLEMSNALRRDVFEPETIRAFAERVPNPEVLRMLTLFTYADIDAVHPDALTSWKAENLWRLYNATANWLDRSVDEARVAAEASSERNDVLMRIHALMPKSRPRVNGYLEGFPQRYLQTRTPETIRTHIELAGGLVGQDGERGIALDFRYTPGVGEITLISYDRARLFASMAGALAAWGMNVITADAFSNAQGIVVDSFRFTDAFRTLELNETERDRFVASVRDVMTGACDLETMLRGRRRQRALAAKMKVAPRIVFDDAASRHSTLLQVVAQDVPGLLRALSLTLAEHGCNIEVALVDTEGESAIDVFYITHAGRKLDSVRQQALRDALLEAIEENER